MTNNQPGFLRNVHSILFFLLTLTLAGCEKFSEKTPLEHIDKALEYRAKGDLRSSSIELKAALQQNPDLVLARQLLGEVSLAVGNGGAAEKELTRALELGANKEAILPSLAEALLLQGKNQQVLDQVQASDISDAGISANLLAYRADALLGMNKPDEARGEYEKALAAQPESALAKVGLARLAVANKDFDKALLLLEETLKSSPQEPKAYSLQGDVYQTKGENEKAEESYGKAIEYRPDNQTDRANRAIVRLDMKKYDLAQQDIQILQKAAPQFFLTHYVLGLRAFYQGNYPEAQAALEASLQANSHFLRPYYLLGEVHFQQNHLSQADDYLSRFLKAVPGSIRARQLLASTKIQLHDFSGAKNLLLPVLKELPNDLYTQELMAAVELGFGKQQDGIDHLKKVVALQPELAMAHSALGEELLKQGAQEQGIQELEKAIRLDPKMQQAEITIILTYLRTRKFDEALEASERLHAKLPQDPVPLNLIAAAHLGKGRETEAREALNEALKVAPGDPEASHNLAVLEAAKGDFGKAESFYKTALQHNPGHLDTLLHYAELKKAQSNEAEFVKLLEQAMEKNPQAWQPRAVFADYYIKKGQPQRALALILEVQKAHPDDPGLLLLLGEAQLNSGETSNAVANLEKLTVLAPKSTQAYFLLAKSYGQIGQPDKMRGALDKVIALDPKHKAAKSTIINLLIDEGKLGEADKQFQELNKSHPEIPEVIDLKAKLALARKQPQQAVSIYEEARKHFPESNLWPLKLAQTQWNMGERESSSATLEGWLKEHPNDYEVLVVLAKSDLLLNHQEKAKADFAKLHEKYPNNAAVLNNLAFLMRSDNPAQALDYAKKAIELDPQNAVVMDTLGVILLDQGQTEEALRFLSKAADKSPKQPTIQFHLVQALVRKGDEDEARERLKQLLSGTQVFQEREQAQELLNKLGE